MVLRTILLIIGVIIILAIAIDGWRRKRRHAQFSRAVEPTIKFAKMSASNALGEALDTVDTTVSKARVISSSVAPQIQAPISTRQQLAFPELDVDQDQLAPTEVKAIEVKISETVPEEPVVIIKRDPRDLEIQTVSASLSANDVSASRPAFRPDQVKSANQVLPAHERMDAPKKLENKVPEVIALTVMSLSNKPFIGYDLIRALEANNLHFGDMNIYHRHKYRNGKGPLYFSVASVTRPGSLDPKNLSILSTPGLCLFMRLDNPKHDRIIFKQMLSTAHDLANALSGAVCDDRRVPLRESTIQGYNEKLNL